MDLNNFVINRVRRATMFSTTDGSAMWNINQVTDPSLNMTTESDEAVDALGARIMQFDRAKNAEFTANNSLFDLGLAAAQFGSEKKVASSTEKMVVPKWEEHEVTAAEKTAAKITLAKIPYAATGTAAGYEIPYIYSLNGDGTLKKKYAAGATKTATTFTLTASTKEIGLPTDLEAGDYLWIPYEYQAESAVGVNATAVDFPAAGKFVMEVLGSDVCDVTKIYYAYIVFPNAKLVGDVDLSFTTDGNHPFTIQAMQDYCDHEKKLFSILIPDTVE